MKTPLSMIRFTAVATLLFFIGCGGGGSGTDSDNQNDKNSAFSTSAAQTVTENSNSVVTVEVTKMKNPVYAITGGADAEKFEIDAQTGMLRFKESPDFENPGDADQDNTYIVTVQASDAEGNSASLTISVTVSNDEVDDGPDFVSPDHITLAENRQLDFTVAANGAVRYALSGEDAGKFEISSDTGKIRFANFLPDWEHPSDSDHDNNYKINVLASDDHNFTSRQLLTITVSNDSSDDAEDRSRITIYKTGADDGVVLGETFGDDRNFSAEEIEGERVIHVGVRMWQDSPENAVANYTFAEAENYCSNLDYAGYGDWRVPNRHEMYEIINYNNAYSAKPTIDDIFQNSAKINYRTSENLIGHSGNILTNQAFAISFTDGASYALDRDQKYGVRCVRGAVLSYTETISKDVDDIYRDPKTGFQWAKPAGPESMYTAKERCENLVFGGYDDWRLPNINELHTIMPSVVPGRGHPYGAEPLLAEGAHQIWSATKKSDTMGRYIDNYWNFGNWGDNDTVPVDDNHPLGRDVMNDDSIELDNPNSVFSICVRGGHL